MQLPYSIIFLLKVSSKGGKESLRESFEKVTYRILHIGESYTMLRDTWREWQLQKTAELSFISFSLYAFIATGGVEIYVFHLQSMDLRMVDFYCSDM